MLLNLTGLSFLLTTDCVGGVFTQTLALASNLIALDAHVIIGTIGPTPRNDQIAAISQIGAEWIVIPGHLDWMADNEDDVRDTSENIARFSQQRRVTSVHLHAPAYAAFGFPWPHIAACHSCHATWWQAIYPNEPLPNDLAWRSELTRRGLAYAEDTIAPSHSFARALTDIYQLDTMPIAIPNGLKSFKYRAPEIRSGAVALGRFWDPGKNIAGLIQIAHHIDDDLKVIGPLSDLLPQHSENLKLLGPQPTLVAHDILHQANVFVSAALYEPFGLAALEAAHAGLALVLSDIPAHRENWDGVAIFRSPNDAEGFAQTINQLCRNPDEAYERGLSAQTRAQHFSVERMGEATALTHLNPRRRQIAA